MDILKITEHVRSQVVAYGKYSVIADESGVTYSWLTKFADGRITNPTIANIHKLQNFFSEQMDHAA